MDVTTMPTLISLIENLRADYPDLKFTSADNFRWSPKQQTVFIDTSLPMAEDYCLHELSHAILGHQTYAHDIDLVKLERDAWEYARHKLAPKYQLIIDDDVIQDNLDTYRNWLHARSLCPRCNATGLQSGTREYHCVACGHHWRVNEARLCRLKRESLAQNK